MSHVGKCGERGRERRCEKIREEGLGRSKKRVGRQVGDKKEKIKGRGIRRGKCKEGRYLPGGRLTRGEKKRFGTSDIGS